MKQEDVSFWITTLETFKNLLGGGLFTLFFITLCIAFLYYAKLRIDLHIEANKQKNESSDDDDDSGPSTSAQDTKTFQNTISSNNSGGNIAINVGSNGQSHSNDHNDVIEGLELANKLTYSNVELSDKYHEAKQKQIDELLKNHSLSNEIKELKSRLKSIHRILCTFLANSNTRRTNDSYLRDIIEIIEEIIPELKTDRIRKERLSKGLEKEPDSGFGPTEEP